MRIIVDRNRCEGHGRCEALVSQVFRVGDDNQVIVLDERPDASLRADIERAVYSCPRAALSVEEA